MFRDQGARYTPENPVWVKYTNNLASGRAIYAEGRISPFTGYPYDHHDGISLRAFYSQEANSILMQRFIRPIQDAASESGVQVYPATLWTPHTTVSDLRYQPGVTQGTKEDAFRRVSDHRLAEEAIQGLQGVELEFDYVFGGNAITLATTSLPTQLLEARRMMTQVAKDLGMGEKDFTNIAHITLARMQGAKKNAYFNTFSHSLTGILSDALGNPLVSTINHSEIMSNQQMEHIHEAPLMKQL